MTKMPEQKEGMRRLPCPFCGSENTSTEGVRDGMRIVCQDCWAKSGSAYHGRKGYSHTPIAATEKWNTRASSSSLLKENEELRKALEEANAKLDYYNRLANEWGDQ